MKNTDAILADAVVSISHRLMDSNEFLIKSHCKMLDANKSLSDSMLDIYGSMCAVRDEMACEKDRESFHNVILALSEAMVVWCEKCDTIDCEIRADYDKSKALKDEMFAKVEGLI